MSITIGDDKQLDQVLPALADPTRRRILELLGDAPRTAGQLHQAFPIAAPAVSRHLRVLREAGLIAEHGVPGDKRVRLYVLSPEPIGEVSRWLEHLGDAWQAQLHSFKDYVALRRVGRG